MLTHSRARRWRHGDRAKVGCEQGRAKPRCKARRRAAPDRQPATCWAQDIAALTGSQRLVPTCCDSHHPMIRHGRRRRSLCLCLPDLLLMLVLGCNERE